MQPGSPQDFSPRVLLIMPDQWHRALLRAELREHGYDAIGARDFSQALIHPAIEAERGRVGLILVDQEALAGASEAVLTRILKHHGRPISVLIAPSGMAASAAPWSRVLRRPLSIGDIVSCVRQLLPLGLGRGPLE